VQRGEASRAPPQRIGPDSFRVPSRSSKGLFYIGNISEIERTGSICPTAPATSAGTALPRALAGRDAQPLSRYRAPAAAPIPHLSRARSDFGRGRGPSGLRPWCAAARMQPRKKVGVGR